MSFSIANTSPSAVITKVGTPSSETGVLTLNSGTLPLSEGGTISGTNTTLSNTKGSPNGTIQLFLKQGDARIDTFVNNTLYSSEKYSSGIAPVLTPVISSGDSLTMLVSDPDFDCYNLTTNFSGTTGFQATDIIEQPDGKLLFCGTFQTYKGESYNRLIRLNADFSIDTSFVIGTGFNNIVNTIALQTDGKILVGGQFTQYSGISIARILRLNSDGSRDTTFQSGTGATGTIQSLSIQTDGKIIAEGQITRYSGVTLSGITRLETNGSIDPTFSCNANPASINTSSIQSDGKIIVAGAFTALNGVTANRIGRLNADGTTDTSFSAGTGFNTGPSFVKVQSDGKIIAGGPFSGYSGTSSSRIIRLNSNGSIDTSFVVGSGFGALGSFDTVSFITQRGDKYLVSGGFGSYQGFTNRGIIKLNNDGSIDPTLNTGGGFVVGGSFSPPVTNLIKSDGEIVVVGRDLGTYEGQSLTGLAVLTPFGGLLNCE